MGLLTTSDVVATLISEAPAGASQNFMSAAHGRALAAARAAYRGWALFGHEFEDDGAFDRLAEWVFRKFPHLGGGSRADAQSAPARGSFAAYVAAESRINICGCGHCQYCQWCNNHG